MLFAGMRVTRKMIGQCHSCLSTYAFINEKRVHSLEKKMIAHLFQCFSTIPAAATHIYTWTFGE